MTKKLDPIATAEAELQNLRTRQTELRTRAGDAEQRRDAARTARKAALAADTGGDIGKHTGAVRDAEDELETIESVLSDVDAQIQETERKLATARDALARAEAAETLIQIGQHVDAAAEQLQAALAPVATAFAALLAALPASLKIVELPETAKDRGDGNYAWVDHRGTAKPLDIARVILAEALANTCPGVFASQPVPGGDWQPALRRLNGFGSAWITERFKHSELVVAITGPEAAAALVTERLKARATAILSGEQDSSLDDVAPPAPITSAAPPKPPEPVKIIARETFTIEEFGSRSSVMGFEIRTVAPDIAAVAVTSGLAYRLDRAEGAELQQQVAKGRLPRAASPLKMEVVRKPNGEVISVGAQDRSAAASVTRFSARGA